MWEAPALDTLQHTQGAGRGGRVHRWRTDHQWKRGLLRQTEIEGCLVWSRTPDSIFQGGNKKKKKIQTDKTLTRNSRRRWR